MLQMFIYLVHYEFWIIWFLITGLSELCIGYEYCIWGHCSSVFEDSSQRAHCTISLSVQFLMFAKGHVTFFTVKQFRKTLWTVWPLTWGHYNPSNTRNCLPSEAVSPCRIYEVSLWMCCVFSMQHLWEEFSFQKFFIFCPYEPWIIRI